jgi:diguanylate cyclase (GGDEF)-like protein
MPLAPARDRFRQVDLMAQAAALAQPIEFARERPRRVLVLLFPVVGLAAAVLAATASTLARFLVDGPHVAAFVVLLAAALVTSAIPVPLTGVVGSMAFESVVVLSTAVLYGGAVAAVVAGAAGLVTNLIYRKPPIKLAYNGATAVLQGAAAGAVASMLVGTHRPIDVLAATGGAAMAFYAVNVPVVGIAIARSRGVAKLAVLKEGVRATALPFVFVTSLVPLVVVAWSESPLLAVTAIGPLAAIGLQQARAVQASAANTMALTDPLTGLGNRRHFDELLPRELVRADREGLFLSLCLVDLDEFKTINDTYGHAAGDAVLTATASCLRRSGEAFRHGGDEFALLLPHCSEPAAAEVADAVCARVAELLDPGGQPLSVSAGTATFSPATGFAPSDLLRAADAALYARKNERRS